MQSASSSVHEQTPERRIEQLEQELASTRGELQQEIAAHAGTKSALERLREQYRNALEQLQLIHRRLFIAKAERREASAEQLAFDKLLDEVQALEKVLDAAEGAGADDDPDATAKPGGPPKEEGQPKSDGRKKRSTPPSGRRDLSKSSLPIVRVEVPDPDLEGKAERIGVEEAHRLGFERGGQRHIILMRIVYKVEGDAATQAAADPQPVDQDPARASDGSGAADASGVCTAGGTATVTSPDGRKFRIVVAPLPEEIVCRGMLAPSMIAHVLVGKYTMGLPFYRLEQRFAWEGCPIDRGTMCRYAEDIGATLGAIVEAARKEAIATAFCLSTDATGVAIQPTLLDDRGRQPCRKGHFFVTLADRDHIFFDYQPKHTSLAVWEMFKGFSGYIQADAHVIYDALFLGIPPEGAGEEDEASRGPPPKEVGCWSHVRRKFWEAAVCKHLVGVEGLRRIDALFDADRPLWDLPPSKRRVRRDALLRPLVDAFFEWAKAQQAILTGRGLVATALGYALRHEAAFRRFLDDGRLRLENNSSERAIRPIAVGRKAWLFFGSDDHAHAAANLFSLLASCKLHSLDPEAYLTDVIRVMPYWPRDRYLELAPKYWAKTRARLDPKEMARPLGHVTVPPPPIAEEQRAAS